MGKICWLTSNNPNQTRNSAPVELKESKTKRVAKLFNHQLIRHTLTYAISDSLNKGIPFLIVLFLTNYIAPQEYGLVATFTALVAILSVFIGLSLDGAIGVNFYRLTRKEIGNYVTSAIVIITTVTISLHFVILLSSEILEKQLQFGMAWQLLGILVAATQMISQINLVIWRLEEKPIPFALYELSQTILTVVLIILFVMVLAMGWKGWLIALTISNFTFAIISLATMSIRGYLTFQINKHYLIDSLKYGLPLIPHSLSGWLLTGIDRFFLISLTGAYATGVYAVGYQLGMVVGLFTMAFNKVWAPYLFKNIQAGISETNKRKIVLFTYAYFILIISFAAVLAQISDWIITSFLDSSYQTARPFIIWIALGNAFTGMYYMVVNYIFYAKKTLSLAAITCLAGILHAALSFTLIYYTGPIGAAKATTISTFVTFLAVWMYSMKIYAMPWNLLKRQY